MASALRPGSRVPHYMTGALAAIAIGLGVALSGAVIIWGGIEKTLARVDGGG